MDKFNEQYQKIMNESQIDESFISELNKLYKYLKHKYTVIFDKDTFYIATSVVEYIRTQAQRKQANKESYEQFLKRLTPIILNQIIGYFKKEGIHISADEFKSIIQKLINGDIDEYKIHQMIRDEKAIKTMENIYEYRKKYLYPIYQNIVTA